MDAKCTDGFLFHYWERTRTWSRTVGSQFNCSRCGTGVILRDRGNPSVVRSVDDPSASALLSQAHLVDPQHQRDSHQDFLDAASPASAGSPEEASLDLPAFLRRQD